MEELQTIIKKRAYEHKLFDLAVNRLETLKLMLMLMDNYSHSQEAIMRIELPICCSVLPRHRFIACYEMRNLGVSLHPTCWGSNEQPRRKINKNSSVFSTDLNHRNLGSLHVNLYHAFYQYSEKFQNSSSYMF
uniref:Uncharacterized protein n=2 Tax=Cacopsylla melanoneura TaxID=428564 RepID=A0A8D8TFS6_9HEMI